MIGKALAIAQRVKIITTRDMMLENHQSRIKVLSVTIKINPRRCFARCETVVNDICDSIALAKYQRVIG